MKQISHQYSNHQCSMNEELLKLLGDHEVSIIMVYNDITYEYEKWIEVNGKRVIFDRLGFSDYSGRLKQANLKETVKFLTSITDF